MGAKECEGRGIELERGEQSTPGGLSYLCGQETRAGTEKVSRGEAKSILGGSKGIRAGLSKGTSPLVVSRR